MTHSCAFARHLSALALAVSLLTCTAPGAERARVKVVSQVEEPAPPVPADGLTDEDSSLDFTSGADAAPADGCCLEHQSCCEAQSCGSGGGGSGFYVGLGGGYSNALWECDRFEFSDAFATSQGFGASFREGYNVSGSAGMRVSPLVRFDVCYNYLNGRQNWTHVLETPLFAQTNSCSGLAQSHVVLFNGYLHPNALLTCCSTQLFDPYIGGGLGFTVNKLGNTTFDFDPDSGFGTGVLDADTTVNFAARVATGFLVPLTSKLGLDVNFSTTYLDTFRTGSQITIDTPTGPFVGSTAPFSFRNNVVGSVNVGFVLKL